MLQDLLRDGDRLRWLKAGCESLGGKPKSVYIISLIYQAIVFYGEIFLNAFFQFYKRTVLTDTFNHAAVQWCPGASWSSLHVLKDSVRSLEFRSIQTDIFYEF